MELACRSNTIFTNTAEAVTYGNEIDREGFDQLTDNARILRERQLKAALPLAEVHFIASQLYFIELARESYQQKVSELTEQGVPS